MKNSLPLILALVGFTMLAVAVPDGVVLAALAAIEGKQAQDLVGQAATVTLVLAGTGSVLFVGGLIRFFVLFRHEERWGPYSTALARLAMEHGQGVFKQPGGGIGFQSAAEGRTLSVTLVPGSPPLLVARQDVPARQPLVFVKRDDEVPTPLAHYKLAGEGKSWDLLAELPALARAHMNDLGVVQRMDRFFDLEESRWVSHDATGLEVVCELPKPQAVSQRAREALDVLKYLRQVNG